MSTVGQYILTVIAAATIVSIICVIVDSKSHTASCIKLISGLFLTLTILSPLLDLQFDTFSGYLSEIDIEAATVARDGTQELYKQKLSIIKEQIESYVLERAETLAADITVDVKFSSDSNITPTEIQIYGSISPYAKRQLVDIISKELGIPEESQEWY